MINALSISLPDGSGCFFSQSASQSGSLTPTGFRLFSLGYLDPFGLPAPGLFPPFINFSPIKFILIYTFILNICQTNNLY
jgi:hypothetical protein